MMPYQDLLQVMALVIVLAPSLLVLLVGVPTLTGRPLSEELLGRLVQVVTTVGLVASLSIAALMVCHGDQPFTLRLGSWVTIPGYHFSFAFTFDRLSLPMVILSLTLCGTISAFANSYMHREPGFNRFFVLYSLFVLGMVTTSLAGTIETLFAGWELVGLSSALLVAFYHTRLRPVQNGLRAWAVYRISDAAFLVAAVIIHHLAGEGDFEKLLGASQWPHGHALVSHQQAFFLGILLLLTAAGKSALVPFSGWLPRAMEGPTPSSAVFYGALSVHLGAFLLLRFSPLIELSLWVRLMIVGIGLTTALFAALAGRVQTDIKSALSFASLTQVGLIVAEIGCGLRYIALIHLLGHACLRTLQFVRAPSLLYDYRVLENAIGATLPRISGIWQAVIPRSLSASSYRIAFERGFLDDLLFVWFVNPFLRLLHWCAGCESRWHAFLAGRHPVDEPNPTSVPESLDDLS